MGPTLLAEVLGVDAEKADAVIVALAKRDIYLMHWPKTRSPKSMTLTSITAAGPIRVEATDIDMGIRMTIAAELSNTAMVLNLPYADAGMVGAWLSSRAIIAQARAIKRESKAA